MKSKMMMFAALAGATALYGQNPLTTELKQNLRRSSRAT